VDYKKAKGKGQKVKKEPRAAKGVFVLWRESAKRKAGPPADAGGRGSRAKAAPFFVLTFAF